MLPSADIPGSVAIKQENALSKCTRTIFRAWLYPLPCTKVGRGEMVQSPKSRALLSSRHCKQTYSSDADRLFKISPTKAEVQHQQKTNFRPTCDGRTPLSAAETSDSTQESCGVSPITLPFRKSPSNAQCAYIAIRGPKWDGCPIPIRYRQSAHFV